MKTIWKFPLQLHYSTQTLQVPFGAKFLHVDWQNETLCIWAEVKVEPSAVMQSRILAVVGTGHPIPEGDARYIGSIQRKDSQGFEFLIFHIYEMEGF